MRARKFVRRCLARIDPFAEQPAPLQLAGRRANAIGLFGVCDGSEMPFERLVVRDEHRYFFGAAVGDALGFGFACAFDGWSIDAMMPLTCV